jgi:hypothetical protein
MDSDSLDRLQHRCGTCDEIFLSIEELCVHVQVHARPAEGRGEPASANGYRYDSALFEDSVVNSHRLNRGLPVKVLLPDEC